MDFNIKTVDSLGRIVIPSMIRKNLNINEDTLLGINVLDSKIILTNYFYQNIILIKLLFIYTKNTYIYSDYIL